MQIFNNQIDSATYKKALRTQKKFLRKFGDDRNAAYHLTLVDNAVLTNPFNCKVIQIKDKADSKAFTDELPMS